MNNTDEKFMRIAIELAKESLGHTRPNPPVGAVVVKNGRIIGHGRHVKCGCDHAEVVALKSCRESPEGATLYVTLEPCSRPGRVGACCDAIKSCKVAKVVWSCSDPNPKNKGRAKSVLNRAGIETKSGVLRTLGKDLIRPFAKHILTGLPFVTVKLAISLDGKICDDTGYAKWVSSEKSRETTGKMREIVDVVMVGAQTARSDNPSLLSHGKQNNDLYRVIISKSGNLPKDLQIFTDEAKERTLVYPNPTEALKDLGTRGFMHVLCEGGLNLARSLSDEGLVDEWITVLCPVVIGTKSMQDAPRPALKDVKSIGQDIHLRHCF